MCVHACAHIRVSTVSSGTFSAPAEPSSVSVFLYHRDPRENNPSADGLECILYLGAMLS